MLLTRDSHRKDYGVVINDDTRYYMIMFYIQLVVGEIYKYRGDLKWFMKKLRLIM